MRRQWHPDLSLVPTRSSAELQQCWIYNDEHLITHQPHGLRSGTSVVIHHSGPRILTESAFMERHRTYLMEYDDGEEEEPEYTAFMQQSLQDQLVRAIMQAGQPAQGPLSQIDFTYENILQCISTPAAAPLPQQTMPNAIVNLQAYIQLLEQAGQRPTHLSITTWFLNHVTYPTCNQPRIVALGNNPRIWARHIVNAWRDLLQDDYPFRFYLVRPTPPPFPHQPPSPHLILVQRPVNQMRSVIVSASHVQHHPGQYVRWAAAYVTPISKETIIHAASATDSCQPLQDNQRCQVLWGAERIEQPQDVQNGASLILLVALTPEDQAPPLGTQHEDDEVWLTQQHQTLSPTTQLETPEQESAPLSLQAVSSSLTPVSTRLPESDDTDLTSLMAATHLPEQEDALPLLHLPGVARDIDSTEDEPPDVQDQDGLIDTDPFDLGSDIDMEESPPNLPQQQQEEYIRYASVIFSINAPPVFARLPYGQRNLFYSSAAAAMQMPESQLVLLHSLPHPPEDLEVSQVTPMIAQFNGELVPGSIHRYILIDVEFHAAMPILTPETERSTKLLPKQLTRSQILRITAVHQYCERARRSAQGCLVWHNNRLVPVDHLGHISLFHGDYLKIALPPDEGTAPEFSTREMAAICWTGDAMFAELGAEGRPFLPQILPEVPPDISTVYALPGLLYEDEASLLQTGGPMQPELTTSPDVGLPLRDITNQIGGTSQKSSTAHIGDDCKSSEEDSQRLSLEQALPALPDFEQQLQQMLQQGSLDHCRLQDGSVLVHTWYLDHHRIPNQEEDRLVYLRGDPGQWRMQLLAEWRDQARPQEWALFHIALPPPSNIFQGEQLHILITQTPDLGTSSVLLSVEFPDAASGLNYRLAVAHSRIASCSTMQNAAKCQEIPQVRDFKCNSVSFDNTEWSPHRLYPVEHGNHIRIRVVDEARPMHSSDHAPTISPTVPFELSEEEEHTIDTIEGTPTDSSETEPSPSPSRHKKPRALMLTALLPDWHPATHPACTQQHEDAHHTTGQCNPVILQLDAALPVRDGVNHEEQVHLLWFEENNWKNEIYADIDIRLHPLPDGLQVPACTYALLCQEPFDFWTSSHHIELYMDGSAGENGAGWSVIATITNGIEERFLGCIWGQVALDNNDMSWMGADATDNISAEFTALAHAQLTATFFQDYIVVLRPDLSLSRTVAIGATTCKSHPRLAKLARNLQRWADGKHTIHEVRGHTRHPWNELADSLAKFAITAPGPIEAPKFPMLQRFLREEHDHNWAWLQDMPPSFALCMPPLVEGQGINLSPSFRPGMPPVQQHRDLAPTSIHFNAVTVNVLALESTKELEENKLVGRVGGNRTARLDAQMHQRGIHILGLQEARSREGRFSSEHYIIFASGALKKTRAPLYGCEIWIHKTLKILHPDQGAPLQLADAKHVVLHSDPRRLMVSCELPGFSVVLASLHAPCLGKRVPDEPAPIEQIDQWWQETSSILNKVGTDRQLLVMVDANAPITDKVSTFTGGHHPDKPSSAGDIFEDFIETNQLFVPSSFGSIHKGPSATWTHSSGNATRRDYVLVSKELFSMVYKTLVLTDHDNAFGHDDHLPLQVCLSGWTTMEESIQRPRLDPDKMLDREACMSFQAALRTLPLPTWDMDIDHHCAILSNQLLSLAEQHFAKPNRKTKRFKLAEDTVSLIALKRQALDYARKHSLITHPEIKEEIKQLETMIKPLVARDVRQHYDALIAQAQVSGDIVNPKMMYKLLRRLGGKKAPKADRPLPKLQDKNGEPVQTFAAQQQLWMNKFAETEAGTPISWDALKALHRRNRLGHVDDPDPVAFPTLWGLQDSVKKLKRGKVPGPDGVPPDLLKAGGDVLLQSLIPLMTKAAAHAREPLAWKGGYVIPLWKGKLNPANPDGYRSIFISSFVAKLYHQQIRSHLVSCWESKISGLQYGGRRHHGTDTAHHLVQTHMAWCKTKGLPAAAVFFDLKAAFYTVLRQSLVDNLQDTDCLHAALQRLGLHPDHISQMLLHAHDDQATDGLSAHLTTILRDMLSTTFFEIKGLDTPCHTTRGTRPGDPVADILFNLAMTTMMEEFRTLLTQRSGAPWLGQGDAVTDFTSSDNVPTEGYIDISFVDDTVVLIHGPHNEAVLPIVQQTVECMIEVTERRGLQLSFDAGKTECIWTMRGKGSRKFKEQMAEVGTSLMWESATRPYFLNLVYDYKHLGTHLQHGHRHNREITARGNACKSQCGVLTRPFFMKKTISLHAKAAVFRSLCLSKLMYNAHVWVGYKAKDVERLTNFVKGPMAVILRGKVPAALRFEITVHHASGLLRVPAPDDHLHAARLRYLARLITDCPAILWNMMIEMHQHDGDWLHQCSGSFQWMHRFYPHPLPVPADAPFPDWITAIALDRSWKGRVKEALCSSIRFRTAEAESWLWRQKMRLTLEFHQVPIVTAQPEPPPQWQCDLCQAKFKSSRALAMRASRSHGYRTKVRYYATSETCPACMKCYHSRKRMADHLQANAGCYNTVQACFPPLDDDTAEALAAEDATELALLVKAGWWASKAFLPVMKLAGPTLPPAGSEGAHIMYHKWLLRPDRGGTAFQQLQGRRLDTPTNEEDPTPSYSGPAFLLQRGQGEHRGGGLLAHGGLAALYAKLNIQTFVFVHFYSGYRRSGDIHDLLDHKILPNGVQVFALSVDLCLERQRGDLLDHANQRWWLDRAKSGQLVGAGGGPPCETFSAARHAPGGPPPLRSHEFPAGLPGLTARQSRQVHVGTRLMEFLIEMLLTLATTGGCGFLEHPQYPLWMAELWPCSVWCWDAMRWLSRLNCFSLVSFDQCTLGADSVKPTTLLLLRMPWVRENLLSRGLGGRCPHGKGAHRGLIGRLSPSSFQTSRAKVYPPGLNKTLVGGVLQFISEMEWDGCSADSLPEEYRPMVAEVFVDRATVQPDYHGQWRFATV